MQRKIDVRTVVAVLVVAALAAAYPVYRWFVAPAIDKPVLPPALPMKGALFLPVALNLAPNPAPGAKPAELPGVKSLPPRARYVGYTDKQRKDLKKQVDDYLRSLGLPMDSPSLTKPAQPHAMILAADVRPVIEADGTVTVSVHFTVTQKVRVRADGSEPWEAVTWNERAEARVPRADTDKAVVALTRECLDRVVKRFQQDNAG